MLHKFRAEQVNVRTTFRYFHLILFLLEKMKISRGLRNNNPLNIRRNNTKWKGLAAIQSDKEFFCFVDACWGYRAAFITLRNYFKKHGLKTLRKWIERWAPPVENDTDAYVRFVSSKSGIDAVEELDIENSESMLKIVGAMSHMENGQRASKSDVLLGWNLSFK